MGSKLKFHCTEEQKIKDEAMEESLGLGKKSYGTETDTETQSWFRLPIPQPGFGRTQRWSLHSFSEYIVLITNDVF